MNEATAATPPFPAGVQERIQQGAFLLVDKPRGPTSHQVAAWVRDRYEVSEEQARADVGGFLEELRRQGLVHEA